MKTEHKSLAHMRREVILAIWSRVKETPMACRPAERQELCWYAEALEDSEAFERLSISFPTFYLTVGSDGIFSDGVAITVELHDKPQKSQRREQTRQIDATCVIGTNGSRRGLAESVVYGQSLRHANELAAWIEAYVNGITAVLPVEGDG